MITEVEETTTHDFNSLGFLVTDDGDVAGSVGIWMPLVGEDEKVTSISGKLYAINQNGAFITDHEFTTGIYNLFSVDGDNFKVEIKNASGEFQGPRLSIADDGTETWELVSNAQ